MQPLTARPLAPTSAPEQGTALKRDSGLHVFFFCALLFALFLRLQAIWPIGLFQDDAVISVWKTEGEMAGKGIWSKSHEFFKNFMTYQGRFKPANCYIIFPLELAVEDNRVLFRCLQAIFQLTALGTFALLCARLSRGHWFWGIVLLVFASIYEIREYHDAAYGQFILCPFTIICGSLSCYFALRCTDSTGTKSNFYLGLATLFSAMALCVMELALPFSATASLIIAFAGNDTWRRRLLRSAVATIPILIVNGIDAYLRTKSIYSGTAVGSISPAIIAPTFFGQWVSGLPLSYFWYDPHRLFSVSWLWTTDTLAAICGGIAVSVALFIGLSCNPPRHPRLLLIFAILLWLIPSGMISLSAKYQRETSAGLGYLQTVFSYLGTSILITLLLTKLSAKFPARNIAGIAFRGVSALGLGTIIAFTLLGSGRVAQSVNSTWRFPREISEVWLRATRPAPGSAETIVTEHDWLARWELSAYLFAIRNSHGHYFDRRTFAEKKPDLPSGSSLIRLRYPVRAAPSDLSLVIGNFRQVGTTSAVRLVALVVCNDEAKLREANLQLTSSYQDWDFPKEIKSGRRGYYYRRLELTVENSDLIDFSLAIRGS